jgi:hypothetical protein
MNVATAGTEKAPVLALEQQNTERSFTLRGFRKEYGNPFSPAR